MSAEIYLWINAVLYAFFALWCLVRPEGTAAFSGLSFLNGSGRAEYLAIYFGLEAGWVVFFALCAYKPELTYAGILFSVCLYAGVIIGRWYSILFHGKVVKTTFIIAGMELVLGIWAFALLANW